MGLWIVRSMFLRGALLKFRVARLLAPFIFAAAELRHHNEISNLSSLGASFSQFIPVPFFLCQTVDYHQ